MKVTVTDDDILNGNRLDPNSCPVALALVRALGVEDNEDSMVVYVGGPFVRIKTGEKTVPWAIGPQPVYDEYALPGVARKFISAFDDDPAEYGNADSARVMRGEAQANRDKHVHPFTFSMRKKKPL